MARPSTGSALSLTVDANVLIEAVKASSPRNRRAQTVLAEALSASEPVYLFWPVIVAFLRVTTHRTLFQAPLSPSEAISWVETLLRSPLVRAEGEREDFWATFAVQVRAGQVRGKLVHDAHLVSLMASYGVRAIITNDRDFLRFRSVEVRDPFPDEMRDR